MIKEKMSTILWSFKAL